MKKYIILCMLIPLLGLYSCLEDTSAYDPQEKEIVDVDDVDNEQGENESEDEELPEGQLVPGIHLVKLNVTQPDGETVERRFKYFMPISIDTSKPISLIFEFHGSYTFDAGVAPSDPISGITLSHTLIQHANRENCVICFPAGTVETQEDGSGAVNWAMSEKHLPFVDAMLDYFKSRTPGIDPNRIYSTGQSSGAIFSFVLAFYRSDVFAAITPRAGQMSLANQTEFPARAVPVRVFAGTDDDIVNHNAVISNMTDWAEKIGGYFASDMEYTKDSIEIEGYKKVDTRIWQGGKTDYQIYSLQEEGHGISIGYCMDYMWEFMSAHTLDGAAENMYITSSIKEIDVQCNEPVEFDINYTDGAELTIIEPKGWNLKLEGKHISMKGPADFYANIDRKGDIVLTITKNGQSFTQKIPFRLQAPKDYFEVGDIYYNEAFEPVGVVFWVNNENIREAKILDLQEVTTQGSYQNINFGDFGASFTTPDTDDGEGNTQKHMQEREDKGLTSKLTNVSSGLVWAATYSYKGVEGWYLPAINEWKEIDANRAMLNEQLTEAGGEVLKSGTNDGYLSSTVTWDEAESNKCFHMMNLNKHSVVTQVRANTSYYYARAIKKVTK